MKSGFIDSLKNVLSERFNLSDREYKTLSDILLSRGLMKVSFDKGLVSIIGTMVHYGYKFPVSIDLLKELWERDMVSINFVSLIAELVKEGIIGIKRVQKADFFSNPEIGKSENEAVDQESFAVVYGKKEFSDLFGKFYEILSNVGIPDSELNEGVKIYPKSVSTIRNRAGNLLSGMNIGIQVESFTVDEVTGLVQINFNLNKTSRYRLADSGKLRIAKKHIKNVSDIEIYQDGGNRCFLSFEFDGKIGSKELSKIADGIFSCFEELEIGEFEVGEI